MNLPLAALAVTGAGSAIGVVGLASGLYPARRAARLPPIEAIGHE